MHLLVVSPGLEPRTSEPKSDVLPLHHETLYCHNECGLCRQIQRKKQEQRPPKTTKTKKKTKSFAQIMGLYLLFIICQGCDF